MANNRVALVTPWFGPDLIGGAERLAWDLAHGLSRRGAEVDVLATTVRSFADDWATNYHRAGARSAGDLTLRRFRVDSRDRVAFARAVNALVSIPRSSLHRDRVPVSPSVERDYIENSIRSGALVEYLARNAAAYRAVFFVPYLYGTTLDGVKALGDRAFLIPCLHDEPYAYLRRMRETVESAGALLFNSDGEQRLAASLYGPWIYAKSSVIGHAIDPVATPTTGRVGAFEPQRSRYVLYLGRQDRTKNVDTLLDAFETFRSARRASGLQLVLAGPRSRGRRMPPGAVDLGAVTAAQRDALLSYARAVLQPSVNESFSRTIYEAWSARRPVVAHRDCTATADVVLETGGGWVAGDADEWAEILTVIDESGDDVVGALGLRGYAAARDLGDWDDVARRALEAVAVFEGRRRSTRLVVAQTVPLGRSQVANYASALDRALRAAGVTASLAVAGPVPAASAYQVAHVDDDFAIAATSDALVVHRSDAAGEPREGALVFAPHVHVRERLAQRGIAATVLPEPVDPAAWRNIPAKTRWDDGRLNIFVLGGAVADDVAWLIEVLVSLVGEGTEARLLFQEHRLDAEARALLVRETVDLELDERVAIVADQLEARYSAWRSAKVALALDYTTVAEVVTAMWFDVPPVAASIAADGNGTIARCSLVLETREPRQVASILRLCANEASLRGAVMAEARRVRSAHASSAVLATLFEAIGAPPAEIPEGNPSSRVKRV